MRTKETAKMVFLESVLYTEKWIINTLTMFEKKWNILYLYNICTIKDLSKELSTSFDNNF
jgi:hypothetical protein